MNLSLADFIAHVRSRGYQVTRGDENNHFEVACPVCEGARGHHLYVEQGASKRVVVTCQRSGCGYDEVMDALGLGRGLTVQQLADFKHLPAEFLEDVGLMDTTARHYRDDEGKKKTHVRALCSDADWDSGYDTPWCEVLITYHVEDGTLADRHQRRFSTDGKRKQCWAAGEGKIAPYGLERLQMARDTGRLVVVEGASDCWTLWFHDYPALGLPGTSTARKLQPTHVAGIATIYVIQEPGEAGSKFPTNIGKRLSALAWDGDLFVVKLDGEGDPSALHITDPETFVERFQEALDAATPLDLPRMLAPTEPTGPPPQGKPTPPPAPQTTFHLTELGNSERFVDAFGSQVRWVQKWKTFLVWDNNRWARDDKLKVHKLAASLARLIDREAAYEDDKDRREALRTWANRCETSRIVRATLDFVRPKVAITHDDLDTDDWLLNVNNGTVDLRTGELQPHEPSDFITKLAPVDYDPDAPCDLWLTTLDKIFSNDDEMILFLQRLFGYALTADATEHVFPIFWGRGGRNGKNLILDTIMGLLGDYACKAPQSLLTIRKNDEHPTELAKLYGKRLVVGSETEKGAKLRINFVKEITGDSILTARFMNCDYFDFQRTFKLVLITNNKPIIHDDIDATWERLRLVPFEVQFIEGGENEPDKQLLEKLKAEWPGILAWAVRGNLDRADEGLTKPPCVVAATEQYQAEENPLTEFLQKAAELGPDAWTATRLLKAEFEDSTTKKWGRYVTDELKKRVRT